METLMETLMTGENPRNLRRRTEDQLRALATPR